MVVVSSQTTLMARESRHLLVSGLPDNINDEKINSFFSQYGRVQKAERCPDGVVVSFMDVRSAQKAQTGEHRMEPGVSFRLSFHEPPTLKNGLVASSITSASVGSPKLENRRRTPSPRNNKEPRSSQLRTTTNTSSKRSFRPDTHRREGRNSPEGASTSSSSAVCVSGLQGVYVDLDRIPSGRSEASIREGIRDALKKYGKLAHVLLEGDSDSRRALVIFNTVLDVDKLSSEKQVSVLSQRCRLRPAEAVDVQLAYSTQLALNSAVASGTRDADLPAKYAVGNAVGRTTGEVDVYSPKASRTLYVGGLESRQSEDSLRRRFEKFGDILDVDVKNFESPSPFAFIQFADIDSAVRAINVHARQATPGQNKKGKPYFGRSISTNKLWVGSIPATAAEGYVDQKLKGMMDGAQDVFYDQQIGQAIVTFNSLEHAQAGWSKIRNGICQLKCDGHESRLSVDFCSDRLLNFFLDRKHNRPSQLDSSGGEGSSILNPPPDPPSDMPTYGYRYENHRDSRRSPCSSSLSKKREDSSRSRPDSRDRSHDRSRDRSRHRDRKSSRYNDYERTISRRKDRKERKASSSPTSSRSSSSDSSGSDSSSSRGSSPLSYSTSRRTDRIEKDQRRRTTDDRKDKARVRGSRSSRSPYSSSKWSDRVHSHSQPDEPVQPTPTAPRPTTIGDAAAQERAQSGDSGFCEEPRAPLDPPPMPPSMSRIAPDQSPPPNDPPPAPLRTTTTSNHILSPPAQSAATNRESLSENVSSRFSELTDCRPSVTREHSQSAQSVSESPSTRHPPLTPSSSQPQLRTEGKRLSQEGTSTPNRQPSGDSSRDPVHRQHSHKGPAAYCENSTRQHGAKDFSLKDATYTAPGCWPWKEFLRHPVMLPLEPKCALKDPRLSGPYPRVALPTSFHLPPFALHLEMGERPRPIQDEEPRKRSSGSTTSFDLSRRLSGGSVKANTAEEPHCSRSSVGQSAVVSRPSSSDSDSDPQLSPGETPAAPPSSLDFLSDPNGLKLGTPLNNTMLARMDTIGSRVMEVGSSFKSLRNAAEGAFSNSTEDAPPAPPRTNISFEERLQMLRKKRTDPSLPSLNLDKFSQSSSTESAPADLSSSGFSRNQSARPPALQIHIPPTGSSFIPTSGTNRTEQASPVSSRKPTTAGCLPTTRACPTSTSRGTPATAPAFPPNFQVPPPSFCPSTPSSSSASLPPKPSASPILSAPPPPPQLPPTPTAVDRRDSVSSLKSPPMTPSSAPPAWKPTTPATPISTATSMQRTAIVRDNPLTPRTPVQPVKSSLAHKAPDSLERLPFLSSSGSRQDSVSSLRVSPSSAPVTAASRTCSFSETKKPPPSKDTSSEYLDSLFNNKAPSTDFRKLPKIEKKCTSAVPLEKEKHHKEKEKSGKKAKEHKQRRKEDGTLETKEERHRRKELERERKEKGKKEHKREKKHREERKRTKEESKERKRSKSKKEDKEKKMKKKKKASRHESDSEGTGSSGSDAGSFQHSLKKWSSLTEEGGVMVGQSMYDRVKRRSSAATKDEAKKNALRALREKNNAGGGKKGMRKRVHLDSSDEDECGEEKADSEAGSSEESGLDNQPPAAEVGGGNTSDGTDGVVAAAAPPSPGTRKLLKKQKKAKKYSSSESDSETETTTKKRKSEKKSSSFNMDDVFGADSSDGESKKKSKKKESKESHHRKKGSSEQLNFESIFGSDLPEKPKKNREDHHEGKSRKRAAEEVSEKTPKRKKRVSLTSEGNCSSDAEEGKKRRLLSKSSSAFTDSDDMKMEPQAEKELAMEQNLAVEQTLPMVEKEEEVKTERDASMSDTSLVEKMEPTVESSSCPIDVVVKEEEVSSSDVKPNRLLMTKGAMKVFEPLPASSAQSQLSMDSSEDSEDELFPLEGRLSRASSSSLSSLHSDVISETDSHRSVPGRKTVELVDATAGYTAPQMTTEPPLQSPSPQGEKLPVNQELPTEPEVVEQQPKPSPPAPVMDAFVEEEPAVPPPSEPAVSPVRFVDDESEKAVLAIAAEDDKETEDAVLSIFNDMDEEQEPQYPSHDFIRVEGTQDRTEQPEQDISEDQIMAESFVEEPLPEEDEDEKMETGSRPTSRSEKVEPTPDVATSVTAATAAERTEPEEIPEKNAVEKKEEAAVVVEEKPVVKAVQQKQAEEVVEVKPSMQSVQETFIPRSQVVAPPAAAPVTVGAAEPVRQPVEPVRPEQPVPVQSSVIQNQSRLSSPAAVVPSPAPSVPVVVAPPSSAAPPPAAAQPPVQPAAQPTPLPVTASQQLPVVSCSSGGSLTQGQPMCQPNMSQQHLIRLQQQQQQQQSQQQQRAQPPAATPSPVPKGMTQQQALAVQHQMAQLLMKDPAALMYQQVMSQMPAQMAQQWLAMYAQQQLITSSQQPMTSQAQQMEMMRQLAVMQQQQQQKQQPTVSQAAWRQHDAATRQLQQQQQLMMMRAVQQQQQQAAQASPAMSQSSNCSSVIGGNERAVGQPPVNPQPTPTVGSRPPPAPTPNTAADDAIESKTPTVWRGQVQMKTNEATVQLHLISGQRDFVTHCLGPLVQLNSEEEKPKMRINQRMRTESQQLTNVLTKLQVCGAACLCVPIGVSKEDASRNNQNLKTHFLEYFTKKGAAGIASMPATATSPASLVYVFPPSDFSDSFMSQCSVQLYNRIKHNAGLGYLFVVVLPADEPTATPTAATPAQP